MSENTFDDVELNKKECNASKQSIVLDLGGINKIVISDKFKHSDKDFKYFIGYEDCTIIRNLWYIKCIDNDGKNMSFKVEDKMKWYLEQN